MRPLFPLWVSLLVVGVTAAPGEAQQPLPGPDSIRVGVLEDWPPHYQVRSDGEPTGFAVDVMGAVARRTGLRVRYVSFPTFPAAIQALRAGDVDVIPDFGVIPSRTDEFGFTRPFDAFRISVFARSSDPTLRSAADLDGRTVGVVRSNAAVQLLREQYPGAELVVFDNVRESLFELLAAGVDAAAYPEEVFLARARSAEVQDRLRILPDPLAEVQRGMGVRSADTLLLARLDRGVEELVGSSTYGEIYQRWFRPPEAFWTVERVVRVAGGLLLVVLLGMGIWRYWSVSRLATRLRHSEERFREIAEHIDDVFWITTPGKETMEYVSPAYRDIWGRSPDELSENSTGWIEQIHSDDRQRVIDALPDQIDGSYEEQYRIVRPDGEIRWIWDRAFPVEGPDGEVVRIIGVAEDVTEREELERQLRHSQKLEAIGRLAGGVAHDFNNLLTIIRANTEFLTDGQAPSNPLREHIDEIREAAVRGSDLTRQLLAFSRDQVLESRPTQMNDVVAAAERLLQRVIGEDIALDCSLEEGLPPVEIDPGQCEQILMNLAVNARDAMPEGGSLRISTSTVDLDDQAVERMELDVPGPHVCLTVTDTGRGMDDDVQERIFEPFFTTKSHESGTGLGLATVYGVVQQSGGGIEVDSVAGSGTTFRLYFPATDRTVEKVEGEPESPVGGRSLDGSEGVLVIEDEPGVRQVLRKILERYGYEVEAAATVHEARSVLGASSDPFDLILTDLVLPDASGFDLIDHVRNEFPNSKLIAMSGYSRHEVLEDRVLEQGIPFLSKPFTPRAVGQIVRDVLDSDDRS